MAEEDLEIVIRLRDLQSFIAGTEEARAAVRKIGEGAQQGVAQSTEAVGKIEGVVGKIKAAARSAVTSLTGMGTAAGKQHSIISGAMGKIEATARKPLIGGGIAGQLGAMALGGLSVAGIKQAVEGTEQLAITAQTFHQVTGMSAKDAAAWSAVVKAHGVNARAFGLALKTVATTTSQFSAGQKAATGVFKTLGINMDEVRKNGGNMNAMMGLVVDRFNKLPPGAEKTTLATKLFGRSWQVLLPLFAEGSKGMAAQRKEAEALGITMGGSATKNAMKMHEAQIQLKLATMGLQVQFAEHLAPAMFAVLGVGLQLIGKVLSVMSPAFRVLGGIVHSVSGYFKEHQTQLTLLKVVVGYVAAVYLALKVQIIAARLFLMLFGKEALLQRAIMLAWRAAVLIVRTALMVLKVEIWAVNAALDANPIGIVVLALQALIAIVIVVITHWKQFKATVSNVFNSMVSVITGAVNLVVGFLKKNWPLILVIMTGPIGAIVAAFIKFRSQIFSIFTDVFNKIKSVGSSIAGAFSGVANALIAPFQTAFNWITSHMPHVSVSHIGPIPVPHISFGGQYGGVVPYPANVLVGERGPEVLSLPRAAQVTPLPRAGMQQVKSNASVPPLVVSVQIQRKEIARAVAKYNDDEMARK